MVLKVASSFDAAEREAKALVIWIWWPKPTAKEPKATENIMKLCRNDILWKLHAVQICGSKLHIPSFEDMWDFQISTLWTLGWNSLLSFLSNVAIDASLKLSGFGDGIKGSTLSKQSDSVQFSGEFNFLPSSSPLPFTWLKLAQSPPSLL